jgi:hypothetical protein
LKRLELVAMAISAHARIARGPRVVFRELSADEGGVLLHLDSGQYHRLNQIGCAIWGLLDGERTVTDLVEEIRKVAVDSPANLMEDIQRFLEGLQARDLIAVTES